MSIFKGVDANGRVFFCAQNSPHAKQEPAAHPPEPDEEVTADVSEIDDLPRQIAAIGQEADAQPEAGDS